MVYCQAHCGVVPVPEEDLPVVLPTEGIQFSGRGGSPLGDLDRWLHTQCPQFEAPPRPLLPFSFAGLMVEFDPLATDAEDQPRERPTPWTPLWILHGIFFAIRTPRIALGMVLLGITCLTILKSGFYRSCLPNQTV